MTEARQPADQAVRERALDPARSCIVQAPAGSGKTDLLIKRYLKLLAVVERPEEILAITFTRKAAAEMRNRVLGALGEADEPTADPNTRQLRELARSARARDATSGWSLTRHPTRLRIQTIDSFNAELTRQLPLLARFGAQPQISETPVVLYEEAVCRTLEELESGATWSDSIEALLRHLDNDWQKAHDLLLDMLPRREQWLERLPQGRDRKQLEQALAGEIRHQLDLLRATVPEHSRAELVTLAAHAGAHAPVPEAAIAACAHLTELPDITPDDLPAWCGIAEMLLTSQGDWRKKPNKNQGFPPENRAAKTRIEQLLLDLAEHESLRRRLHFVRLLPRPVYDDSQWQLLQALVTLLPLAAAQLKVVFGAHGQVDFPELAGAALQALGPPEAPTDLMLRLDYRIRHILVDEFQDTSLSQYRLLELLTAGWTPGDGRSLFVVGDPMQSIYRFREAEVGLYLETRDHGLGQMPLERLQLNTNFRSQQGIVDWVNDCFSHVLPAEPDSASGAVPYARAEAWHLAAGVPAVAVHPQFGSDPATEAAQIIELIERQRLDHPDATIAVLVQNRNHLAAIVPLLRRRGVRYRAVEIERLGRQPVVQDLLALTRALLHPADRIAWLSILRAPWCGLTLADLHALAADRPGATGPELLQDRPAALSADGHRRLQRVAQLLDGVLASVRQHPLRDVVESAWLALGGPSCAGSAAALDDATAYFALLETIDEAGDLPAPDTLRRELDRLFAPPDPEADEGLQILTVHKAKGLEFEVVILPGLGRRPRRDDDRLLLWQARQRRERADLLMAPLTAAGADRDPIYAFLKALEKERAHYERGRQLYVACTRARKQLHLFGHVNVREDSGGSPRLRPPEADSALALLWPQVETAYQQAVKCWAPSAITPAAAAAAPPPRRLAADWTLPILPAAVELPGVNVAEPEALEAIEFSWAGETARIMGLVVHRLLLRIAVEGAAWPAGRIDGLRPVIERMLDQQGLPSERRAAAADQVRQALGNTLADDRGRWILAGHQDARSEYALSRIQGGRLESVILDRTFVDDQGIRWIIDYKTGPHGGGDRERFLNREQARYRPQLERYAEFMRGLEQRPIRLGLYFPLLNGWREWPAG